MCVCFLLGFEVFLMCLIILIYFMFKTDGKRCDFYCGFLCFNLILLLIICVKISKNLIFSLTCHGLFDATLGDELHGIVISR